MSSELQVVTEQPNPDEYLTIAEVCDMLWIGKTWVSQMIYSGKLDGVRYGRRVYVTRASTYERLKKEKVPPQFKHLLKWLRIAHAGSVPRDALDSGAPRMFANYFFWTKKAAAYRQSIHEAAGEVLKAADREDWRGAEKAAINFWQVWEEYEVFGQPISPEMRAALSKPIKLFEETL